MPPRRKTSATRRRRSKPKISLIQTITSLAILNGWTNASAGMGIVPFLSDGWMGRKASSASDNSWEVSLYEMVQTALGNAKPGMVYGSSSYTLTDALKKNFKDNGANALMMTIALPVAVGIASKVASKPINQVNRLAAPVFKPLGVKL